ncbi:MAG: hypothetical protein NC548_11310 [Lachnospiraceae bacterium]|nr:hypothetical protein [Lachnospiraceae bacterium]
MFDLSKVKVVFCDWDDTLAIHNKNEHWHDHDEYLKSGFCDSDEYYTETVRARPNVAIHALLSKLKTTNYVLTWCNYTFLLRARRKFLSMYYTDIDFSKIYVVASPDKKRQLIEDFMKVFGYKKTQVLLIEDRLDTLESCWDVCLTAYVPELYALYCAGEL